MGKLTEDIKSIITPVLTSLGYELVGVEYLRAKVGVLRIYIDKPSGVNLENCAQVSQQISRILDVEQPISNAYNLEVSSPGVARPLFDLKHYRQFLGYEVKIKLKQKLNDKRHIIGTIKTVFADDSIEIVTEIDTITLAFDQIDKANLIAQF